MIAVAIPQALAVPGPPEVVPVDECRTCDGTGSVEGRNIASYDGCWSCDGGGVRGLVGQRVALAWRERCETCGGSGMNHDPDLVYDGEPCSDCDGTGSRMVVGWTAEVERVDPPEGYERRYPMVPWRGRYALVLRDLRKRPDPWDRVSEPWPMPCRLFDGFAELDEVLR